MNLILIIDDEKEICESIQMILEYEGYKVDYSTSASEGLEKISEDSTAALLLDIQMPEMSGFEVLKKVKGEKFNYIRNYNFSSRQCGECY